MMTPVTSLKSRTRKPRIARRNYPIPPAGKISLSLDEVCGLTNFGMTTVRQAVDDELLTVHRYGKRITVRRTDLDEFLKKLPRGFGKKGVADK